MANVFDYINDFFAGGEEALRNIEKELERSFIKNILAPAKKARVSTIEKDTEKYMKISLLSAQESLKEVSKNIDSSMKGEFSTKVVETIETKSKEYPKALNGTK